MIVQEVPNVTANSNPYQEVFDKQNQYLLHKGQKTGASERIALLRKLYKWIWANRKEIQVALHQDFSKAPAEVDVTEIKASLNEIDHIISHLRDWMREKPVETPLQLMGITSRIYYEPKGASLIISPWNFPFMLAVSPLASAIAAGCPVVIKPSEVSHHTSALLERMAREVFSPEVVTVIQGSVEETGELLKLPWAHIFFTGSPRVGKIVMLAAADTLSSVTLELGGRNPVIVDQTADIPHTCSKLVWGKFFNCGQSCMSPNYVYVHRSVYDKFKTVLKQEFSKNYGDPSKIKDNPDFARVIDDKNFSRIKRILDETLKAGATIVFGGETEAEENFVAPTVLDNVPLDSPVMLEEIFGPVLPLIPYDDLDDLILTIQGQDKPLALNIFSRSRKNIRKIIESTSAGSTAINETTFQFGNSYLPFGGIGNSGLGRTHGHAGFLDFTNERAILQSRSGFTLPKLVATPYKGKFKAFILEFLMRWM